MTYPEFFDKLASTQLFTNAEVHKIARTVGTYTVGNAVIACEVSGIELSGNDIDIMIEALND